jgi:hypothetical protein
MTDAATPAQPRRNPTFNRVTVQTVLAHLGAGHSFKESAARAGIADVTLRNWIKRGNVERTRLEALGIDDPDDLNVDDPRVQATERAYLAFSRAVKLAEGEAAAELMATLYQAGTTGLETEEVKLTIKVDAETGDEEIVGRQVTRRTVRDLKAAMWLLERLDADRYHLPASVHLSGPNGEPLHIAGTTEGQAQALAMIVRTYTDGILALCPPRTKERIEAAIPDLLQEAFAAIAPKEIEPA